MARDAVHLPVLLTALLGLLASIAALHLSLAWERRVATLEFEGRALDHLSVLNADLQVAASVIDTLRAYMESTDRPVTDGEFARFLEALHSRVAGLQDAGWAPRVPASERDAFERAMRASGLPAFEIRERDPAGRAVRAAARDTYYPILYLDGSPRSKSLIGLDLASEPVRGQALARAVATGRPAATPPLELVTVAGPTGGVMSFTAVHRGGGAVGRMPDGVVFGAFGIAAMLDGILDARPRLTGADLFVFDPSQPPGGRAIVWRPAAAHPKPQPSEAALRALPHWEGTISIVDQRWGAIFLPDMPDAGLEWSGRAMTPPGVALLLTVLAVAYLVVSQRRTAQLRALTLTLRRTTDDLRATGEQVAHMARHDPLTGLPNRRSFAEMLDRATTRGATGEHACAIMQIDLDRFKSVNDVHGHEAGDVVLREVASRLRAVASDRASVARLGGDEFAAIVACGQSGPSPGDLASQIIASVSQPIGFKGITVEVGATIGIGLCPADASEPDALLRAADMAMYRAKRGGRGRFYFFERDVDGEPREADRAAA